MGFFFTAAGADVGPSSVEFSAPYSCGEHHRPHNFCAVTRPQEFSGKEKQIILNLIADLNSAARPIFKKLFQNDQPLIFYRYQYGADQAFSFTYKRDDQEFAWVPHSRQIQIHLTDLFFKSADHINQNFTRQHQIILHELTHLFDNNSGNLSGTPDFLDLYGWHQVDTDAIFRIGGIEQKIQRWQLGSVSYQEVDDIRAQVYQIAKSGNILEAESLSFEFADTQGHPGSYSMVNPAENFAELVTSELIDKQRMASVPSEVRQWLHALLSE